MIIKRINPGLSLAICPTKKFKDITINLRFYWPLSKETLAYSNYCSELISWQCAKYPTKESFSRHLDYLYGATYVASSEVSGTQVCLSAALKVIKGSFVNENLLPEQLLTLIEVVFHPCLQGQAFDVMLFNEARNNLLANIARDCDNPASYAASRASEIFGENYPLAVTNLSIKEQIENADNKKIYLWYQSLLQQAYCDIIAVGDVTAAELQSLVDKIADSERRECGALDYVKKFNEYREVKETGAIQQSQLRLLFQSSLNMRSANFYHLMVANALFGQIPTSLLFQEVREKRSLCYSIYSRNLTYDTGLVVSTGIDKANIEETIVLVKKLYEQVKIGDFSEELLQMAKDLVVNALQASYDRVFGYINTAVALIHVSPKHNIDHICALVKAVKKDDVCACFSQLRLETVYSYQQED